MLAKVKKVALIGAKDQLHSVIDALKATGNFQMTFYKAVHPTAADDAATRHTLTTNLHRVTNVLNYLPDDRQVNTLTYAELQGCAKKTARLEKLLTTVEQTKITIADWQQTLQTNQARLAQLRPFANLPIASNLLKNTRRTFVLAGRLPQTAFNRWQNDLSFPDLLYETYPADKHDCLVVITGALENLPIANLIYDYDFTPFPVDPNSNRTPQAEINALVQQNTSLAAKIVAAQQQLNLNPADLQLLKTYHDYLQNELDTLDILANTMQTQTCFVVNGWIPAQFAPQLKQIIQRTSKHVIVNIKDSAPTDQPPAIVRNSHLVTPYQSITAMYGAPGRNDLDPNPFVAIFYFLFFGMMFGDVAYGLLLTIVTTFIIGIKRPQGSAKQLLGLFAMGGISAALWGLVFNSWFGLQLPSFIMPRTLINPLGNDAILFFALSLYFGVIQIAFGNFLNLVNQLRQRHWLDALCRALPHLVCFVGLTLAFPQLITYLIPLNYSFLAWFQPCFWPGVITMFVGVAGMILGNGIGKKLGGYLVSLFTGAYQIITYFSDILSYARLFGVGLVGCVIAYVANYLFGMFAGIGVVGYLLGGIVAVIFHAINIALGLLSTYIHNARLQFVEFFGKFYAGTGTVFAPLGSQLRYTRLRQTDRV